MKKIFTFLSVFTIVFIAFLDAKDRFNELNEIIATTPAQMEMKKPLNRSDIESRTLKIQSEELQSIQERLKLEQKKHLQQSIDNMNRQQQQKRQSKNPLQWR